MTASRPHLRSGAAACLTLFTLAALLSGCAPGAPADPGGSSQPPAPTQSGPASPASAPASTAPVAPARTALTDSSPFQALTAEQQQKISALEAMDQATFEKQSRDDQLAFGAFLREAYQDAAIAAAAPDIKTAAETKVSSSSSGPEIVNDEVLKAATARWSAQPDSHDATATAGDTASNYTKMAPSRVSPLFTEAYKEVATPAEMNGETVLSDIADPTRMVVVDESNNFLPLDGSREELAFKVVELQRTETQAPTQFYFAYTPFVDIHGAEDGVWILMEAVEESDETWIPDLSVID